MLLCIFTTLLKDAYDIWFYIHENEQANLVLDIQSPDPALETRWLSSSVNSTGNDGCTALRSKMKYRLLLVLPLSGIVIPDLVGTSDFITPKRQTMLACHESSSFKRLYSKPYFTPLINVKAYGRHGDYFDITYAEADKEASPPGFSIDLMGDLGHAQPVPIAHDTTDLHASSDDF